MTAAKTVFTEAAPRAIGPYSQAKEAPLQGARVVFTSGQVGLDPRTGELVPGGVGAQAEQALRNLVAVLEAAGLGLAQVVKTTVYLADMEDFQAMNEVYARHFGSEPPARTTIAAAGLPRGARIEIECIAVGSSS